MNTWWGWWWGAVLGKSDSSKQSKESYYNSPFIIVLDLRRSSAGGFNIFCSNAPNASTGSTSNTVTCHDTMQSVIVYKVQIIVLRFDLSSLEVLLVNIYTTQVDITTPPMIQSVIVQINSFIPSAKASITLSAAPSIRNASNI